MSEERGKIYVLLFWHLPNCLCFVWNFLEVAFLHRNCTKTPKKRIFWLTRTLHCGKDNTKRKAMKHIALCTKLSLIALQSSSRSSNRLQLPTSLIFFVQLSSLLSNICPPLSTIYFLKLFFLAGNQLYEL